LALESLEQRAVPAALPFGAAPDDTGEFMLGDVLVTVVLMESSEEISATNSNSETWTEASIAAAKQKVQDGLAWWEQTLADITDKHELNFKFDFAYADNPVVTSFEPITRSSRDFEFWIYDFLNLAGFNQTGNFSSDIRQFNHAQREAYSTHWAFTIFVVNDENDTDGEFASGGFSKAFAFAGGRFFVTPAGRPASTITHETGHIFWARDEYRGGGNYNSPLRGYYKTQNANAWDNPSGQQVASIMDKGNCESGGGLLCDAYQSHTSSPSSLEMIGWRDSDGDGIFDVLDVPLTLEGSGVFEVESREYAFQGTSGVQSFPNQNPSGLGNDITINTVSRAEYRIDGVGGWQTAAKLGGHDAVLDLRIPVPTVASQVEIRTLDDATGVASPILLGTLEHPATMDLPGISGYVFDDANTNGQWESGEIGLAGWTVQLVDAAGAPIATADTIEPDDYAGAGGLLNDVVPGITLTSVGTGVADDSVSAKRSTPASTGDHVFASFSSSCGGFCTDWTANSRNLRMDFALPASQLWIDAVGRNSGSIGRLEIYNSAGELLARHSTSALNEGDVETMTLSRPEDDIAYAIAGGHSIGSVKLDNLRVGAESSAVTDALGTFRLPYLPPGEYTVEVVAADSSRATSPSTGQRTVQLTAGESLKNLSFGFSAFESPWQNPNTAEDVNNDGSVSPIDVLFVINDLNRNGARKLLDEPFTPYLDVDGNGFATSQDALQVINVLNRRSGGEAEPMPEPSFLADREVDEAEGEAVLHSDLPFANQHQEIVSAGGTETTRTNSVDPTTQSPPSIVERVTIAARPIGHGDRAATKEVFSKYLLDESLVSLLASDHAAAASASVLG
jgi:hypothetical protein